MTIVIVTLVIKHIRGNNVKRLCVCLLFAAVGSSHTPVFKQGSFLALLRSMKLFAVLVFLYPGSAFKVLDPQAAQDAQESAEVTKLKECHQAEKERLARQRREAGILGIFGDLVGGVCGGVYAVSGNNQANQQQQQQLIQEKQELLVQAEVKANADHSLISELVCALGEGTIGLVEGAVSWAHEEENADADNCQQMAAVMTLQKIDDLQQTTETGGDCSGLEP